MFIFRLLILVCILKASLSYASGILILDLSQSDGDPLLAELTQLYGSRIAIIRPTAEQVKDETGISYLVSEVKLRLNGQSIAYFAVYGQGSCHANFERSYLQI